MRAWGAVHFLLRAQTKAARIISACPPNSRAFNLPNPFAGQAVILRCFFSSVRCLRAYDAKGDPPPMDQPPDYTTWTNSQLIARVTKLEQQLRIQHEAHANSLRLQKNLLELEQQLAGNVKSSAHSSTQPPPSHPLPPQSTVKPGRSREFLPSKYNTRVIALRIAYFGRNYNGFEYHDNNATPLPTVEEELWKALNKTKLIFPTNQGSGISWEGCEYTKCGRTDKGVSAFGQVISLRVRSARPKSPATMPDLANNANGGTFYMHDDPQTPKEEEPPFDEIHDELEYPKILNRVLPEDIRVLAWCPSLPPGFSARFSCRERHYRYFFTQPAYAPRAGRAGLNDREHDRVRRYGWLDTAKMQRAAELFEGTHDFRNFCKIDPSRQITNYQRKIFSAYIEEAPSCSGMPLFVERQGYGASTNAGHQFISHARVFCFTVKGTAFLWHQIRCMVAVLFLVGQGLEDESVIQELLDVGKNPSKPLYDMADESPLVLWDCIFPAEDGDPREDSLPWVYPDEQQKQGVLPTSGDGRYGPAGINEVLWASWRRKKMDELLAGSLLDIVTVQGFLEPAEATADGRLEGYLEGPRNSHTRFRLFEGGDGPRSKGEYVPLMQRERMDSSEIQNAKYLAKKGLTPQSPATPNAL